VHRKVSRRTALAAAVLGVALCQGSAAGQTAGSAPDLLHYGRWQINNAETAKLNGRPSTRSDTFTWIYAPEKDGIRHTIYESYPAPQPSRSYFARLDGQPYPDPHGPGKGEVVRLWPVNKYTVVREMETYGKRTERVAWAISSDGKKLVNHTMAPDGTDRINVMVFDRMEGASATR